MKLLFAMSGATIVYLGPVVAIWLIGPHPPIEWLGATLATAAGLALWLRVLFSRPWTRHGLIDDSAALRDDAERN